MNARASRPEGAIDLLAAVDRGAGSHTDVSSVGLRQLQILSRIARLNQKVAKVFGNIHPSSTDKRNLISKFQAIYTPERLRGANLPNGRALFNKTCAQCHTSIRLVATSAPISTGSPGSAPISIICSRTFSTPALSSRRNI